MSDVCSGNNDDAANYVTFDDYLAGASKVIPLDILADNWNNAHPDDPVIAQGTASEAPNITPITPDTCGVTRVFAALQLIGGGLEIIVGGGAIFAPEPTGATKVIGAVVIVHGLDTIQASMRTIATCDRTATFTQLGATSVAKDFGANPASAQTIGVVTDIGIGVGGTFGVGVVSKVGATGQLVHLTNAESAAAIRGSQTLGLGRSTIYAGPETLAQAKGWSILVRTGIPPSQATEAILLPSQATKSFLVVSPIGPFSAWQSLNGSVFSAGAGSFNLVTGVFTRSGVALNQLAIYGIDSAIMTSVRAAPEVVSRASGSK
jgi:hypothetical protein